MRTVAIALGVWLIGIGAACLLFAGCATVPVGSKLLCKQLCDEWGRGRPGPIMSVTDPRTCACQSAGPAAPYHAEPLPAAAPLVSS